VYACSNFFRAMRPNLSIVDPDFLTQVLVKVYRSPAIWRYQQQTTGLVNLKFRDYLEQPLLLPPLNEQRRIVELIEAVSAQERAIEASIAKLSVIRASLVQVKLDQLYADHVRMALDDVASVERGRFSARPRNDPSYFGGQYHFIQTGDVVSAQGGVIWQSSQRLNEAGLSVSRMFPAGTVAVTIAANIGDTAILGERMCFPDSVVGVVAQAGFTPRFLELCLRRAKPQLEAQAPQSAQRNINLQALRPLGIPDVPQEVQDELVNTWDACGEEVGSLKEELTKLRKLKQGLVTDLLSGRISA
jgi:type I restriction enzyme S subunit